jgi:hypothetical protein
MTLSESDSDGAWMVFMVGQGDPANQTKEEIARPADVEIA